MSRKPAAPVVMWCAIHHGKRAEWINHNTIRRTRVESRKAFLAMYCDDYLKRPGNIAKVLSGVRFARVTIEVQQP